jgi:hypothetical protein
VVYVALAVECFLRFSHNAPFRHIDTLEKSQRYVSKNLKVMLFGIGFCTLCIFIRLASITPYYPQLRRLNTSLDPCTALLSSPMGGRDQSSRLSVTLVRRGIVSAKITLIVIFYW